MMAPLPSRLREGRFSWLGYILLAIIITLASHKLVGLFGPVFLLYAIGLAILVIVYAAVSFKSLLIPFLLLIASIGMLRFVWAFQAPFLPDLFLDRISLIWLTLVFTALAVYTRRSLRKPFLLDLLLLMHATYIATRVLMTDPVYFHTWTMSTFTPYAVYFFAKNIVWTRRNIQMVLIVLAVMSFYYTVTSISEKFHIQALLFPRRMIEPHPIAVGRSSGPFRSPGMFGDTMGMVLPVFLYFITQVRNRASKLFLGLSLLLGFVAILFTYTRGSMLAALLGMGVVVFLNRKAYLSYVLPLVVVMPLVAIMVVGVQDDEFLQERLESTNPIESRVGTIVTAVRLWRANPLFGCGSYQYKKFADDYVAPIEAPLIGTVRVRHFRGSPAHDMYFGPLAEDGAIGAILQILIYFVILRSSIQKYGLRRKNDHFATYILPLFFGIYAVYFFGGMIISFRHFAILGSLFYMAAGITYGYNPEESGD